MINCTHIDVTSIKASIRTLLRGTESQRKALIEFVKKLEIDPKCKEDAVDILIKDLEGSDNELGYPIPVIDIQITNAEKEDGRVGKEKRGRRKSAASKRLHFLPI